MSLEIRKTCKFFASLSEVHRPNDTVCNFVRGISEIHRATGAVGFSIGVLGRWQPLVSVGWLIRAIELVSYVFLDSRGG